jgi:hypothetical protein
MPAIGVGAVTNSKGEFAVEGLLPGGYELAPLIDANTYGPPPTARVRLGALEQKRGVVLRTARNG